MAEVTKIESGVSLVSGPPECGHDTGWCAGALCVEGVRPAYDPKMEHPDPEGAVEGRLDRRGLRHDDYYEGGSRG